MFLEVAHFYGPSQYGFRIGKGTADALCALKSSVQNAIDKYVLGIFLDISGAFDNAWWPLFFHKLQFLKYPQELYTLLYNYV